MMRKAAALSIIFFLILSSLTMPVTVHAAEKFVWIEVQNGSSQDIGVIQSGTDLLISGEDLVRLTGFSYTLKNNDAIFARGVKTIRIDLSKNIIYPMETLTRLSTVSLNEKIRQMDGKYYFPASQLLPWLNVSCFAKDGCLYILPDAASLWDAANGFKPNELRFDFEDACSRVNKSSKWVKSSAYFNSFEIGNVFDYVPKTFSSSWGSYMDYYDIFDEMFQNKDGTLYSVNELMEENDKINKLFKTVKDLDGTTGLPDEIQFAGAMSKSLSSFKNALGYALYYESFKQDNSVKLEMLDSISSFYQGVYDYPDAMISAAIEVEKEYTDFYAGLEAKFLNNLLDWSTNKAVGAATGSTLLGFALDAAGLNTAFASDWNKKINQLPEYEALAASTLDAYKDNYGGSLMRMISTQRSNAMLYLYSTRQCYLAMQALAENEGKQAAANYFEAQAEECNQWYGKFLATAGQAATANDSHEYAGSRMKESYAKSLLKTFSVLNYNQEKPNRQVMPGALAEFINMDYKEIKSRFPDGYQVLNGEYVKLSLNDAEITLDFSPPWDGNEPANDSVVNSLTIYSDSPNINSIGNSTMGQTLKQTKQELYPTTTWSAFSEFESGLYMTSFLYRDLTFGLFHVSAGFDGTEDSSKLTYVCLSKPYGVTDEEYAQLESD